MYLIWTSSHVFQGTDFELDNWYVFYAQIDNISLYLYVILQGNLKHWRVSVMQVDVQANDSLKTIYK